MLRWNIDGNGNNGFGQTSACQSNDSFDRLKCIAVPPPSILFIMRMVAKSTALCKGAELFINSLSCKSIFQAGTLLVEIDRHFLSLRAGEAPKQSRALC